MVLLYVFGGITLLNILFYLAFAKFSFQKISAKKASAAFPVSILVCAKNEAENLRRNIPAILSQNHLDFEVILINDASTDDTLEVMEEFQLQDSRVKIVNVAGNETFWGSKKYALTFGIKRAKNKHLVFTDADCVPSSTQWLSKLTSHMTEEKQLILGYGAYKKERGLLNAIIRFETLLTATQYFSCALNGMPYMGVGRNLAYTSPLFFDNKGFINHMKIMSGDDDLFVNEVATAQNTAICYEEDAMTTSLAKTSWKSWMTQKRRHVSAAAHYKPFHKFILGVFYLSNLLFLITAVLNFFFTPWQFVVVLIAIRFLIQGVVLGKAATKLQEKNLIPFFLFLEMFLILSQFVIFILNSTSKQTQWK
jgi:glycosyltransferase involved in cell wall biosynthesis